MEGKDSVDEKKLSYEELEKVALNFQRQAYTLNAQLKSIDMAQLRLNYLFRVLEYKDSFDEEFVKNCSEEIVSMMTVQEEESNLEE